MQGDFAKIRLNDGYITNLVIVDNEVRVTIRNWREGSEVLVFQNVIGLEAFSIANTELSHGTETSNDSLLERSCLIGEEQLPEFRCYAFFSPWSECPILKVVARSVSMEKA